MVQNTAFWLVQIWNAAIWLARSQTVPLFFSQDTITSEMSLKMSKSHANVVSFDENVSYLLTSMNLYERNEQFLWTKQLLNWQDKHWHHYCKIAILSWWTKHWPPVHGLPQWNTLKWTTPKNNIPNEYFLMFLAASIIKLHITSAYVHPVQPLVTILNNCT